MTEDERVALVAALEEERAGYARRADPETAADEDEAKRYAKRLKQVDAQLSIYRRLKVKP